MIRFNDKVSCVRTKKELLELMKPYRKILSSSILNYLYELIELDYSVVCPCIDFDTRKIVSDLDIYKDIAIYNIYMRAISLFSKDKEEFDIRIDDNSKGLEGINIYAKNLNIYRFDYSNNIALSYDIPDGYKTNRIGSIDINRVVFDDNIRYRELEKIKKELDILYNQENPFSTDSDIIEGPAYYWEMEQKKKIGSYEKIYSELTKKRVLTDYEKMMIEISQKYYELVLSDYELNEDEFKDDGTYYGAIKSNQEKTYTKKIPNLVINNNIRYL